jgi:hypothetical protein
MGSHPINLAVIFLLEIAGLAALGTLGWYYGEGINRYLLAPGLPLIAAAFWGIFAVPGDPSRSGKTVVQTPGVVRVFLELTFFASATCSLFFIGKPILGWMYGVAVLAHYLTSYDRIQWLLHR